MDKVSESTKATPPVDGATPNAEPQTAQRPRRGRGRPFKSNGGVPPLAEQAIGVENTDKPDETAPKQQRRRKSTVDVGMLAKNLKGIHELAAKLVPIKGPDGSMLMALSDVEATQLADAIAAVAKEYDLELSGKTGSAIQLLGVACMVYGPRLYVIQQMRAYMQQQQRETAAAARASDASVVSNIPAGVNGHQPAAN